jgi:hypothetical protein
VTETSRNRSAASFPLPRTILPPWLEDEFGPGRNAKRLGDDIDSAQCALHRGHFKRVAGHFFELGLLHKALAAASGAVGGGFGLAALPVELPISTIIMLRSIGDIARSARSATVRTVTIA